MLYFNPLTQIFLNGVWDILRLSTVGWQKKIKQRRVEEKKIEFLFGLAKSTLFCKLWSVRWLVRLANVCAFVCRLIL
jgi:hypothetical protein